MALFTPIYIKSKQLNVAARQFKALLSYCFRSLLKLLKNQSSILCHFISLNAYAKSTVFCENLINYSIFIGFFRDRAGLFACKDLQSN